MNNRQLKMGNLSSFFYIKFHLNLLQQTNRHLAYFGHKNLDDFTQIILNLSKIVYCVHHSYYQDSPIFF